MKKLRCNSAIIVMASRAVALCVGGSIFGLIAPAPYSHAQAARSDSQQKSRVLTFADRVAYQYAIEEVYWRHRIWPKENPNPKPSLDKVMSRADVDRKVEHYLRNSQVLADQRQRPITPGDLQAEMDRIASHTKQPHVLHELFSALNNDPYVIAECLARPILIEPMAANLAVVAGVSPARNFFAADSAASTGKDRVAYVLPEIAPFDCADDTWTPTTITSAPPARELHTAVWTGSEMIVWGGVDFSGYFNTGGRYNPTTDSWTATSTASAPAAREIHTAVWTGSEMIVWGGYNGTDLNTGGRYNPGTDSWTATSTANAPAARDSHTAVWTGSEMIVWGGFCSGSYFNTGGRYNPSTGNWAATSTTNAPAARALPTAVWTGSEMLAWGGFNSSSDFNTGGRYNPGTDSWTVTSITNAPAARDSHTAVWTGSEMLVWGGETFNFSRLNTGGRYNPGTDSWIATSTASAPAARDAHTAVWTGSQMIVWGGFYPSFLNTGGRYNPSTDSWTATSDTGAPAARDFHTAVWTGSEMIVWGGGDNISYFDTGGRYCAQVSVPVVTSALSRKSHGGAGTFDVNLPITGTPGVECRTSGGTNDYIMVVTFSGNVTVTGSPQAEVTLGTGCVGTGGTCSGNVTVSGNTVTVPLTNVSNVQTINVRINGVNGAADIPATDFTIPMSILIGDTNANGTVNAADVAQTKSRLGQTVDASNFRSDVNANGSINAADTAIVKQNSGTSLPP
jgi:N-acetylneuraminic acid mutarotase